MSVSDDRWTCPACCKTEMIPARSDLAPALRQRVQLEHSERHKTERREGVYATLRRRTEFRPAS